MNLCTKPISTQARSKLQDLINDPQYIKHHYDEANEYIVVTMKHWFGYGANVFELASWHRDHVTGGYLIPYSFKANEDLA